MTIQLNADNNLELHEAYRAKLTEIISSQLGRFNEYITRIEVHLTDENNDKVGIDDKRCVIEARLKGHNPIAVKDIADTYDNAVNGALRKMKASLDTFIGKLKEH